VSCRYSLSTNPRGVKVILLYVGLRLFCNIVVVMLYHACIGTGNVKVILLYVGLRLFCNMVVVMLYHARIGLIA
jgi:hypothetical protein